ncbi:MAG: glycosyltransferase family 4 protein [Thermoguttaceae bacterium]
MRFCFVLANPWLGGPRTFVTRMAKELTATGHSACCLLVMAGSDPEPRDLEILRQGMELNCFVRRRVWSRSAWLAHIVKTIANLAPDVLVLNHSRWGQAVLPYLDRQIVRLPVVHSITNEELDLPLGNAAWWDVAVGVGPLVYEGLVRRWPAARVRLIPVGVDEPKMSGRMQFDNKPLRICFVGRMDQRSKNILLLPEIARLLQDRGIACRWTMVGDGPDRRQLEQRVNACGLKGLFEFAGVCSPPQVEKILSEQNILVLPSFYESIGNVLQEAQILGVVPVASRLPGATDFVVCDRENGRLCESDSAGDFAKAIAELAADRGEMQRLATRAQVTVRERFLIPRIARGYCDLYEEITSRPRCIPPQRRPWMGTYQIPPELAQTRVVTIWRGVQKSIRAFRSQSSGRRGTKGWPR